MRIRTGDDGDSPFDDGWIYLSRGESGDVFSDEAIAASVSYHETGLGGTYPPRQASTRQLIRTPADTREFKTIPRETLTIDSGDARHQRSIEAVRR